VSQIVSGSIIFTIPVSSSTVTVQIKFEPDMPCALSHCRVIMPASAPFIDDENKRFVEHRIAGDVDRPAGDNTANLTFSVRLNKLCCSLSTLHMPPFIRNAIC
jgi:hypothetical protein